MIFEAIGSPVAFNVLPALAHNGIFVLTGIPAVRPPEPMQASRIMRDIVHKNQLVLGTVNAGREAHEEAIHQLAQFMTLFPEAVRGLITRQVATRQVACRARKGGGRHQDCDRYGGVGMSGARDVQKADPLRVVVLGGGPAGVTAALHAADRGARVTLVERGRVGGTALNCGPAPVRPLARAARLVRDWNSWEAFGLRGSKPTIDLAATLANAQRVANYAHDRKRISDQIRGLGVDIVEESG